MEVRILATWIQEEKPIMIEVSDDGTLQSPVHEHAIEQEHEYVTEQESSQQIPSPKTLQIKELSNQVLILSPQFQKLKEEKEYIEQEVAAYKLNQHIHPSPSFPLYWFMLSNLNLLS